MPANSFINPKNELQINSKYCHTGILLNDKEISIVNNFLDTL